MDTIWLKQRWPYIAVSPVCDKNTNWGAVEKAYYRGGGHAGRLFFRPGLRNLIQHAVGFNLAHNGHGPRDAGSGYLGWADYGSIGHAVAFLSMFYNVQWCPVGGVIITEKGLHIPFPTTEKEGFWDSLRVYVEDLRERGHAIKSIVFRRGGNPIPPSFINWCNENGINFQVIDDPAFDDHYPPAVWSDEDGAAYV